MTATTLPLSSLKVDPANVRKHSDVAIDEMVAMIRAKGIIQSLHVRPNGDGRYMVTAGGRRFLALSKMLKAKEIDADYPVPVIIGEDDDAGAREISLMENVGRVAMTPVEEFRAFAQLRDDGASVETIALRFGCPERTVRQRLALAALDKGIVAALDKDEISLDVAQAFTVTSDAKRQRALFKEWREQGRGMSANAVRRALTEGKLSASSPLALAVGEEAYRAAGGTVTDDLFADGRHWDDAALAYRLARLRMTETAAAITADGWSWVMFSDEVPEEMGDVRYGRHRMSPDRREATKAEQKRIDKITAELEGMEGSDEADDFEAEDKLNAELNAIDGARATWTAEQKTAGGVVLDVETGEAIYGVVKPADARRIAAEERARAKQDGEAGKGGDAAEPEGPKALAASLMQDLMAEANIALQKAVAADADLALSILLAKLSVAPWAAQPVKVTFGGGEARTSEKENFAAALKKARAMKPTERAKALTVHIAGALQTGTPDDPTANPEIAALYDAALPDLSKAVTVDADTYFARVTKERIYAALADVENDQFAEGRYNGLKKGELVEAAARVTAKSGWLPPELRFASYDGPVLAKKRRKS